MCGWSWGLPRLHPYYRPPSLFHAKASAAPYPTSLSVPSPHATWNVQVHMLESPWEDQGTPARSHCPKLISASFHSSFASCAGDLIFLSFWLQHEKWGLYAHWPFCMTYRDIKERGEWRCDDVSAIVIFTKNSMFSKDCIHLSLLYWSENKDVSLLVFFHVTTSQTVIKWNPKPGTQKNLWENNSLFP